MKMDNQTISILPAATAPAPRPQLRPMGARGPRQDRDRSARGGPGDREGRQGPRRFGPPMRRVCPFCKDPNRHIDYKNGEMLRRYLTERGKIRARRKIGTCARHQRQLALAIKRARHLALLPYSPAHLRGG